MQKAHMTCGGTGRDCVPIDRDSIAYCYYLSSVNCKSCVWWALCGKLGGQRHGWKDRFKTRTLKTVGCGTPALPPT